jgi:hypothetical protein
VALLPLVMPGPIKRLAFALLRLALAAGLGYEIWLQASHWMNEELAVAFLIAGTLVTAWAERVNSSARMLSPPCTAAGKSQDLSYETRE